MMLKEQSNCVLCIGGIDPTGAAGVLLDTKVVSFFDVSSVVVVTANTVQTGSHFSALNPVSNAVFIEQFSKMTETFHPQVIKTGVLCSKVQVITIAEYLQNNPDVLYVCDPVIKSSSGGELSDRDTLIAFKEMLLPKAMVITPNAHELKLLSSSSHALENIEDVYRLRLIFQEKYQPQNVLLKGGHLPFCQGVDYLFGGKEVLCYLSPSNDYQEVRGTGCALASGIAALLAKGETLKESITLSKFYLTYNIAKAKHFVTQNMLNYQQNCIDSPKQYFPKITEVSTLKHKIKAFPTLKREIGFYPIVDSALWVERLAKLGVLTIQLRLKGKRCEHIESEIMLANKIAREYKVALFINDHWQYAIKHQCFGVHLGQEDLQTANLQQLYESGICLGISTHDYTELAKALYLSPSYIALGPIFGTQTKTLSFSARGMGMLNIWRGIIPNTIQLVAIGGINKGNIIDIVKAGVHPAVISYLSDENTYQNRIKEALNICK